MKKEMPTLYKDNMYIRTGRSTAKIKVFHKNEGVWLEVGLKEQDVKYIEKHCKYCKELVPTLQKSGKQWYLVFPFEQKVENIDTPVKDSIICAWGISRLAYDGSGKRVRDEGNSSLCTFQSGKRY